MSLFEIIGDEMDGHFGVGLGIETMPLRSELVAQLAEILDDAVVDESDACGGVRVRVRFGGRAVCRPARMADARAAGQRIGLEHRGKVAELAGRAAALDMTARK